MKGLYQSVGKEAPIFADNEDAWYAAEEQGIWALADGAGGTGIFAGEWAQYLVNRIPDKPFIDFEGLDTWLGDSWEAFFNHYQPAASLDYLMEQKFMREGSAATLVTLHKQGTALFWSSYGDAVLLNYNAASQKLIAANPTITQFSEAPFLLNWLWPASPEGFCCGHWPLATGNQYALVSDTMGQFLLMAYAALTAETDELEGVANQPTALGSRAKAHLSFWEPNANSFDEQVWQPLRKAMGSKTTFLTYTHRLKADNLLASDDYTCLLLTF